jgi:hypothetical protein
MSVSVYIYIKQLLPNIAVIFFFAENKLLISIVLFCRRSFIQKSKHGKHPNNVIIEGRLYIVVPKATTAVSNFLTTCVVVDGL